MFFFLQPSEAHVSFSGGTPMHSKGSATASGSGGCIEAVERSASLVEDALLNVDSGSEMNTKIQNTPQPSIASGESMSFVGNVTYRYLYRYQSIFRELC
jgi:hypothetical protein